MGKKAKLKVGILFGGKSAEHEVSLQSAKNIIDALDKKKYEIILIPIDKNGIWYLADNVENIVYNEQSKIYALKNLHNSAVLIPWKRNNNLFLFEKQTEKKIDVIFPVLHGTYGEDGTIQGLLKLANIPFVGAGVLGSAVGMDKDVMKRLLHEASIPVAKFIVGIKLNEKKILLKRVILSKDKNIDYIFNLDSDYNKLFLLLKDVLRLPFFIKPANLGSSVGVNKVHNLSEFVKALHEAFSYDFKILFEEYIEGREIECSVLGNTEPIASLAGEIIPQHEFYDYEAKYLEENGAILKIPADINDNILKEVQSLAVRTFTTLCCEGMGRVDFFLTKNNYLYVNEINTIPGFTKISMYPKLWEASGISYSELIDRLIQLALEKSKKEQQLITDYKYQ